MVVVTSFSLYPSAQLTVTVVPMSVITVLILPLEGILRAGQRSTEGSAYTEKVITITIDTTKTAENPSKFRQQNSKPGYLIMYVIFRDLC